MAAAESQTQTETRRETCVFVSYARLDKDLVDWIAGELRRKGLKVLVDVDDTEFGQKWWDELERMMGECHALLFMLSPNSAGSKYCRRELDYAQAINKRIIPVMIAKTEWRLAPEAIAKRHCVFLDNRITRLENLEGLVRAVGRDIEWIREHTRLGELVIRWKIHNRREDELLRGAPLDTFEAWAAKTRPAGAPPLTALMVDYLKQSRLAADRQETDRKAGTVRFLRIRSRFLSILAARETSAGNPVNGMLLALEGLDEEGATEGYAHVPEVVHTLYDGLSANRELAVLAGHGDELRTVAFAADGMQLLTTSEDGTARLWHGITGAPAGVLAVADASVRSAAFSPDGRTIGAALSNGDIRLFDAATCIEQAALRGPDAGLVRACFSPDGSRIVGAAEDGTAHLWDVAHMMPIAVMAGHSAALTAVAFSADGRLVITASDDKTARIWDGSGGHEIAKLSGHTDIVLAAALDPGGGLAVTGSRDGTARVWRCADGRELAALAGHGRTVCAACFSPDGKLILTSGADHTARLWDAATYAERAVLRGHEREIPSAVFSRDSGKILTASHDRTARVWDAGSGELIAVLRGHNGTLWGAAFSPDGERVATAAGQSSYDTAEELDNTARLWSLRAPQQARKLPIGADQALAFSPDNRTICGGSSWSFDLWDLQRGESLQLIPSPEDDGGQPPDVQAGSFSADGTLVATVQAGGIARVFEVRSGREIQMLESEELDLRDAVFSPDGRQLLTTVGDDTARLWDVQSGKEIKTLRGHQGLVKRAAFSPDGKRIVTASADETARLWDVAEGRELIVLDGHEGGALRAAFSPDGCKVLTCAKHRAAIWDAASGKQLLSFAGLDALLMSAAFSPDGTRILARCDCTPPDPGAVRLWDAETGAEIWALKEQWIVADDPVYTADGQRVVVAEHFAVYVLDAASGAVLVCHEVPKGDAVIMVAVSPDGRLIAGGSERRNAYLWEVIPSTGDLIADAKRALPRGLLRGDRDAVPLDPDPPDWYVEMGKWPYASDEWKRWLAAKKARQAAAAAAGT